MDKNEWQIYAVRYARHDRAARENFMAGDPHDDSPMPLDHYVWAVKSPGRTFVIDTGFDEPMARKRGRFEFVGNDVENNSYDLEPQGNVNAAVKP